MAGKRGNGEGSIYRRASDGRWLGAVSLGYDEHGRARRKVVSARTRVETVQKLKKLQHQLEEGLPPPDARMTVAQLLDRWYSDVLRHQVAPSASGNYKSIADHHIVPSLGQKRIGTLTPADVDHLLAQKMDSGLSVSTVKRIRSVLVQGIGQGVRWGCVSRNVAALSRSPRAPRREGRTLTPAQAQQLLHALKGHRHEALYALMLSTGLRKGETLGLQWKDFDESLGVISVRRQLKWEGGVLITSDTKTSRSRRTVNLPVHMIGVRIPRVFVHPFRLNPYTDSGVFVHPGGVAG